MRRSSPLMWAEALDVMFGRLARSGIDLGKSPRSDRRSSMAAVPQSRCAGALGPDPARPLAEQIAPLLSRRFANLDGFEHGRGVPRDLGGSRRGGTLSAHTGSRAFERFTGPQIRKFSKIDPSGYAATDRVHLVSSFMAS